SEGGGGDGGFGVERGGGECCGELFLGDGRGRGGARGGERRALFPRDPARGGFRRRPAQRRVRPFDPPVDPILRPGQDRRGALPAHRRHHTDQGRGRLLGISGAAQYRVVRRRRDHDGGNEPAPVRLRAGRHSGDRAAPLRFRPRGAPTFARRTGYFG